MRMRLGLGPVFVMESMVNARRWQVYAGRAFFVFVLLIGMGIVWITHVGRGSRTGYQASTFATMAKIGEWFFYTLTSLQISLILLAAPAAAAGCLGTDSTRGKLWHMMVTDLSDAEIVLGTLAARLTPVVGLILCSVPVVALAALLGGIEYPALAGALVVDLTLALLGCKLALTLSVWVTKTHEVLMAVYMALGVWLLSLPIWHGFASGGILMAPPDWFSKANPYVLALAPYTRPGYASISDFAAFAGGILALSAVLAGVSIARLRRVVVAQASGSPRRIRRRSLRVLTRCFRWSPGPTLDGNPVLWREWHRNRPSRLARWIGIVLVAVTWGTVALGSIDTLIDGPSTDAYFTIGRGLMISIVFGFLMLSAQSPTALADERARGTLEVLLASPLSTHSIVVAKWWGVFRRVLTMLPLFLFAGVLMAVVSPDIAVPPPGVTGADPIALLTVWDRFCAATFCPADFLASGALLVSVGLLISTWVRRLGRAIVISVVVFFLIGFVWPLLVELFWVAGMQWLFPKIATTEDWSDRYRWIEQCLTALSPLGGASASLETFLWYHPESPWRWAGLGAVIAIKAAAAGLLLGLSVLSFDRCVGRVSERPRGRAKAKPKLSHSTSPQTLGD